MCDRFFCFLAMVLVNVVIALCIFAPNLKSQNVSELGSNVVASNSSEPSGSVTQGTSAPQALVEPLEQLGPAPSAAGPKSDQLLPAKNQESAATTKVRRSNNVSLQNGAEAGGKTVSPTAPKAKRNRYMGIKPYSTARAGAERTSFEKRGGCSFIFPLSLVAPLFGQPFCAWPAE
jgi:hypothetical protein